jgi:hypothetical protein
MYTAEPLKPRFFETETDTEKLKGLKSPNIDQILAELTQKGGNTLHS